MLDESTWTNRAKAQQQIYLVRQKLDEIMQKYQLRSDRLGVPTASQE